MSIRKQDEEGNWQDFSNHAAQSARENLNDIMTGFFDGEGLEDNALRKIFRKCSEIAESTFELCKLADEISLNLNDEYWCLSLILIAEDRVEDSDDFLYLAESIIFCLDDKDWAKRFYFNALQKSNDTSSLAYISGSIAEYLEDKEWAAELIKKCLAKAEDCYEISKIAQITYYNFNDLELTRNFILEAAKFATNSTEYCTLSFMAGDYLNDETLCNKFLNKSAILASNTEEFCGSAFAHYYIDSYDKYLELVFKGLDHAAEKDDYAYLIQAGAYPFNNYMDTLLGEYLETGEIEITTIFKDIDWALDILSLAENISYEEIDDDLLNLLAYCIYQYNHENWQSYKFDSLKSIES